MSTTAPTTNTTNTVTSSGNNGYGYSNVFNKVEKFEGKGDKDLVSWFRLFERACTIAQKTDDLVKGQLLMLCLSGQALAVAEHLEEEQAVQQNFTQLKTRLETVFNTTATKESKMVEFENRVQRVEESEDEFMLSLTKLYKAANPNADDATSKLAIKRKFMSGISAELRRSIYIFCNEPYHADVTCDKFLEHVRQARLQILQQNDQSPIAVVKECASTTEPTTSETNLLLAINFLEKNMNERIDSVERRYDEVNAISSGQHNRQGNNFRGGFRGGYRGYTHRGRANYRNYSNYNQSTRDNNGNLNNNPTNNSPVRCHKCNGENHFARNCLAKN